ncbi:MAG: DUF1599 domain-containing protein [Saprospiraceae bacterium]|nr:DUF1599 domain-containing protein [Saprospiraceae bacterium]
MEKTLQQYQKATDTAKDIFIKKTKDYGTAWRILRPSSLTDQLYIKASRIRSIQEKGESKVEDPIDLEFVGIINYSVMALIQLEYKVNDNLDMPIDEVDRLYAHYIDTARNLMEDKNHDYGEAWRDMRVSSITDLILMKLLRVKQIENNDGKTIISEGLDANYLDMINYAVFAMILIDEEKHKI